MPEKITIGNAELWHGDCREILPTLPVFDLICTDPPYGIALDTNNSRFSGGNSGHRMKGGGENGIGTANGAPIIGDEKPFDPSFLLAYGKSQIIWGWNNYPNLLPRGACLVWLKRLDAGFGSFLSDAETAFMSKGHGVYCKRDLSNNAITKERSHPTQKPVSLMHWCLEFFPHANTVLDPFMGSGTTGVACAQLGKAFTGIERERKYFDIACERIARAQAQGTLLPPEPPPQPEQTALL